MKRFEVIIVTSLLLAAGVTVAFYLNVRAMDLALLPYEERYDMITRQLNEINKWMMISQRSKSDIRKKLGDPFNDVRDDCWIWIPLDEGDLLGRSLLECNYGRGGYYLDLRNNTRASRIRSIPGHWEDFQDIVNSHVHKK